MELTPVLARPSLMGRLWPLVAVAVFAPLALLVVLPSVLGLQRYVVTSDALGNSVPRGSLTFAESVPAPDIEVGDVITFRPPGTPADAPYVTRRVVRDTPDGILTSGDGTGTDPWVLSPTGRHSRVVAHIPYVGYPFIAGVRPTMWVMLVSVPMLAVLLAVGADVGRARQRRRITRHRDEPPVTDS
ncbi:hypothetical protein [Nocardioides panacihumi]